VNVCADGFQDADCDVRFMRAHRQVALHLEAVGLPVTYLAAATYMEDLLDEAAEIRQTAEIRAPAGDGRAGFIADVAAAAAAGRH
jgi:NAD(P)H dehydrogenase (quinone)